MQVHPGLPGGQGGVGVVPRLVVVVLHVQVGQLRVLDSQGAAGVVDVLPVQGELRRLGCDHVWILDQCLWIVVSVSISFFLGGAQNIYLESVVLGECHNLHDFPDSGKDLEDDVKCDRVHHVLHDHPESE